MPATKARIARSSSDDSHVATQETLQAGVNPSETVLFVPKAEQNFADFDVRSEAHDRLTHCLLSCMTSLPGISYSCGGRHREARPPAAAGPLPLWLLLQFAWYSASSVERQMEGAERTRKDRVNHAHTAPNMLLPGDHAQVFDFDGSLFGADFLDSGVEDLGSTPNSPSDGARQASTCPL